MLRDEVMVNQNQSLRWKRRMWVFPVLTVESVWNQEEEVTGHLMPGEEEISF